MSPRQRLSPLAVVARRSLFRYYLRDRRCRRSRFVGAEMAGMPIGNG